MAAFRQINSSERTGHLFLPVQGKPGVTDRKVKSRSLPQKLKDFVRPKSGTKKKDKNERLGSSQHHPEENGRSARKGKRVKSSIEIRPESGAETTAKKGGKWHALKKWWNNDKSKDKEKEKKKRGEDESQTLHNTQYQYKDEGNDTAGTLTENTHSSRNGGLQMHKMYDGQTCQSTEQSLNMADIHNKSANSPRNIVPPNQFKFQSNKGSDNRDPSNSPRNGYVTGPSHTQGNSIGTAQSHSQWNRSVTEPNIQGSTFATGSAHSQGNRTFTGPHSQGKSDQNRNRTHTTVIQVQQNTKNTGHPIRRPPKGLPNMEMSCYANSIFQVLGQTPFLLEKLSSKRSSNQNTITTMLYDLVVAINGEHGSKTVGDITHKLLRALFQSDRSFQFGYQNDSHSFLLALFECIRKEHTPNGEQVLDLFEGKMHNEFVCDRNHRDPIDTQVFSSLLIPIVRNRKGMCTVSEGLNVILGEELFRCDELPCRICQKTNQVSKTLVKRLVIDDPPPILVLQLGKFRELRNQWGKTTIEKDNTRVFYDDTLDQSSIKSLYRLFGVVSHSGSLQGGHYIAYVKTSENPGKWFRCSDLSVTATDNPARSCESGAFLLFYSRSVRYETYL